MLHNDFLRMPIAHRALHNVADGRPENSLAAVRAAIDAGYGIEIDLQLSKDGVPMVFHDYSLTRLTGENGPVAQRTAAELQAMTLLGGTEGAPTFAQVLDAVAGKVPLLVEIKDQDGVLGPNVGVLEQAAAQAAQDYTGPLAFMSFNPHAVIAMAKLAPETPRGLTTCTFLAEDWPTIPAATRDRLSGIPDYDAAGACFVSHDHRHLSAPRIAELREKGASVLCWTIRSPEDEAKAREYADNITFEQYLA